MLPLNALSSYSTFKLFIVRLIPILSIPTVWVCDARVLMTAKDWKWYLNMKGDLFVGLLCDCQLIVEIWYGWQSSNRTCAMKIEENLNRVSETSQYDIDKEQVFNTDFNASEYNIEETLFFQTNNIN